jgi:cytoskeletal protein RodZ
VPPALSSIAKAFPIGLNRSGMSTVSEQLRQARQAQNLTVEQIAEVTKIRSDHVRALEDGNFDVFSAPVYIRGFTRTYSTLLKLDVPRIMAALDEELGQTKKFSEPPPLSEGRRGLLDFFMLQLSKVDWRKGLIVLGALVACLALLIGWASWKRYRANDPLKGLTPGLYNSTQHLSGETLPLPAPGQPARR